MRRVCKLKPVRTGMQLKRAWVLRLVRASMSLKRTGLPLRHVRTGIPLERTEIDTKTTQFKGIQIRRYVCALEINFGVLLTCLFLSPLSFLFYFLVDCI